MLCRYRRPARRGREIEDEILHAPGARRADHVNDVRPSDRVGAGRETPGCDRRRHALDRFRHEFAHRASELVATGHDRGPCAASGTQSEAHAFHCQ